MTSVFIKTKLSLQDFENSVGLETWDDFYTFGGMTKLPDGFILHGDLEVGPDLLELPPGLYVGRDLDLQKNKNITKLPDNMFVGGILDLRNTKIKVPSRGLRIETGVKTRKQMHRIWSLDDKRIDVEDFMEWARMNLTGGYALVGSDEDEDNMHVWLENKDDVLFLKLKYITKPSMGPVV